MATEPPVVVITPPSSVYARVTTWISEHKVVVAGAAVVVGGAGIAYVLTRNGAPGTPPPKRPSKRERREAKKRQEAESQPILEEIKPKTASIEKEEPQEEELPEINETTIVKFSDAEKNNFSIKLKNAGNDAFKKKDHETAIDLYSKAILCKADPIFYSNRAACYNAQGEWEKVVEDTTAALAMDNEYVKALNRRANAYEKLGKHRDSLVDYTASCIIEQFRNEHSAQSVERMLKKVAEEKAHKMMEARGNTLPSSSFVGNYLSSFRARPLPAGLEKSAELDEQSGKGQLQAGFAAIDLKTSEGYIKAAEHFEKAVELNDLGDLEYLAYSMRGTFRYLRGDNELALADLTKSIELNEGMTVNYVKRASMHLELNDRDAANKDFETAIAHDEKDSDIYYHRGQLYFILGEFKDAAKDYQKSIDLDKDFIFAHIQLGVTQYKMGSIASSMATFRRTIKNFEKHAEVYNYYGEILFDQQKFQEAIEKFDTALEMEKQNKPVSMNVLPLVNKALAYFQWKQDYPEAEKLINKALIIDPENDVALATMAQVLLQQGRTLEALSFFDRAAEAARTLGEMETALSFAEATRTQHEIQVKYPSLATRMQPNMGM